MVRPLEFLSGNIEQMSDADLDRLQYYLRVAYAAQLNSSGNGYIFVGATETSIGSASDTSRTQQTASTTRVVDDGVIQTYPSYPGTGTETDSTFSYRQDQSVPSFPSSSTLDTHGFAFFDHIGNETIQTANTASQIYSEVLSQCITDMRTGDEVGTYRISVSTPTNGGAGTWVDKGTWYTDSTYDAGTTTYKLWLKTALTAIPGSAIEPLGLDGSDLKEREILNSNPMIQNVLLPALTRRMSDGDLLYTVGTSVTGVNRGSFTDTRQESATNTQTFTDPNYISTSTPSGSATTQTTYYLNLS